MQSKSAKLCYKANLVVDTLRVQMLNLLSMMQTYVQHQNPQPCCLQWSSVLGKGKLETQEKQGSSANHCYHNEQQHAPQDTCTVSKRVAAGCVKQCTWAKLVARAIQQKSKAYQRQRCPCHLESPSPKYLTSHQALFLPLRLPLQAEALRLLCQRLL